jgi:hypothetical protein
MNWLCATVLCLAACGGGGGFPDAPPEPDGIPQGTMSLDWSLVRMSDGSPITCNEVDGTTVTLLLRNRAFNGGFTEVFSCNTKSGVTGPMPVGTYDVNFELTGTSGTISTAPEQQGPVVTANSTTALTPVTFSVNAVGAIDLKLDAGKTGGNCDTLANNGAEINGVRISLNHAAGAGACEPATLMIGATPYTINCTTPVTTGCIEKTTSITATLPSDNYQIHIRADQAPNRTDCFSNDDSIRVPPNNGTLMRTLNLASSSTGGCM